MIMQFIVFLLSIIYVTRSEILVTEDGKSLLNITVLEKDGLLLDLIYEKETKLSAHIGRNINVTFIECFSNVPARCLISGSNNTLLSIHAIYSTFMLEWTPLNPKDNTTIFNDCFNLNSKNVSWYGGPETFLTEWPIEKLILKNRPLIASRFDNGAVIEPYWLNSKGALIKVYDNEPIFIDQNNDINDTVCFKSIAKSPFQMRQTLAYTLLARNNSKEAHLVATNSFLGKPQDLPNIKMMTEPIWTTWGKFKANINDENVIKFLKDIYNHNFTEGQIEIDDKWESCYGDQFFNNKTSFANIKSTVQTIHDYGFRATLWTHPFVNTDCKIPITEGLSKSYFVNSSSGNPKTSWWNGNSAYIIDFTSKNASDWFKNRLLKIHDDIGIDGFKCDAGESDWLPKDPIFHNYSSEAPNIYTQFYLKTCSELGKLVEVRSGIGTQTFPIFVRMLDKDSVWGNNNGLKSIIHSLLQFNMIGYTFVLPDLVGGNGYNGQPSSELLVRWTQANVFMPAIQFSYLPWELENSTFNATAIVRKMLDIREIYSHVIVKAMRNSMKYGVPVNPPIWWIDPHNEKALKVDDEYLLGEKILVAPILEQGSTSRDIYLPLSEGTWVDGNTGVLYAGNITLKNYTAPIDVLPYFVRFGF